jgi:hypothetical protein
LETADDDAEDGAKDALPGNGGPVPTEEAQAAEAGEEAAATAKEAALHSDEPVAGALSRERNGSRAGDARGRFGARLRAGLLRASTGAALLSAKANDAPLLLLVEKCALDAVDPPSSSPEEKTDQSTGGGREAAAYACRCGWL